MPKSSPAKSTKIALSAADRKHALHHATLELVTPEWKAMTEAMILAAKGETHFYLRDFVGVLRRETDVDTIDRALADPEKKDGVHYQFVTCVSPDVRAWTALADRTIDKPIERTEVSGTTTAEVRVVHIYKDAP